MKRVVKIFVVLLVFHVIGVHATINFGGRESAIDVSGGTLALGSSKTLTEGVIRDSGGAITATTATCSGMVIETVDGTTTRLVKADGSLTLSADQSSNALTLSNNQILVAEGGTIFENLTVAGAVATPSILQGHGAFDTYVTINGDDDRTLISRWLGTMNKDIWLNAGTVAKTSELKLENDLVFAKGFGPTCKSATGTGKVSFNGYKMTIGAPSMGTNGQTWDKAHILFTSDTTLQLPMTLTTAAGFFDGGGYKITFSGSGGFLGSVAGTVANAHVAGYSSTVFGGTGTWTLHDVILSTSSNAIRVIDGALTAGTANVFAGNTTWPSASQIELLKDLTIGASSTWTFSAASFINGNDNTLALTDTSGIIDINADLTLTDINLTNMTAASINNAAGVDLLCDNVSWYDGAQAGAVCIDASPYVDGALYAQISLGAGGTDGALFNDAITWNNGARLSLLQNTTLGSSAVWTLSNKTVIDGKGHMLNFGSGVIDFDEDLYLTNVILGDVAAGSLVNGVGTNKDLYLSNVIWVDDATEGAIRVSATTESTVGAAQVSLATTNSGNLFSTAVTWNNGANIELLKDITFSGSGAWTFSSASVINGNGHIIDISSISGALVSTAADLTISNAVIKGWGTGSLNFTGQSLILSNVTIIMDGNYTISDGDNIVVNGPLTIVTGTNTFDASAAATPVNQINSVTVWYDSLGNVDSGQVQFGSFTGGGKISMMPLSDSTGVTTYASASNHVTQSLFLSYDIDVGDDDSFEARGKQVEFDNTSAFTVLGNGRTFYMSPTPVSASTRVDSPKLVAIDNDVANLVTVHDLVFDGWAEGHFTGPTLLRYGNGSVIRLQADQAITDTITFANAVASETAVLDLNGFDLDMSNAGAELTISNISATVTIKNGRIINLSGAKITSAGTTSTWVFQDVDLVLSGDTTFSSNSFQFKGNCNVTGSATNKKLSFYQTPITITDGATLTIDKTMTLELNGDGAPDASITLASGTNNATLSLIGATLDIQNLSTNTSLVRGTLRVDDKVTIVAGSNTLTLGGAGSSDLDIDIMPAARLIVSSGTVSYANAS